MPRQTLSKEAEQGREGSRSTSTPPAPRSLRGLLSGLPKGDLERLLDALTPNALMSVPWLFEHWALEHQLPPEGDWTTWVILGGRGAGKTRAGAEWVRAQVEGGKPGDPGTSSRVALVGETLDEAREVMVFGPSGILACTPPDRRPEWQASRKRLVWPNGAVAQIFSASAPETLRGPQFDAAWCDEVGKWGKAQATWDNLQFALRLGKKPRAVVTTTPRRNALLQALIEAPTSAVTRAPTAANRMHLAPGFVEAVTARYANSDLGRQELDGEFVLETEGALWTRQMLAAARRPRALELNRVVVAIDPPVTSTKTSDACGIVVVGAALAGTPKDWAAEVIFDGSIRGASPTAWAERAVELYHRFGADRLVAEVNQGGEMVQTVVRGVDPLVSYRAVRATTGKAVRAEPVAALYEQGRVFHRPGLEALEDEMAFMAAGGFLGHGSPDRVDALVWAITDLLIEPSRRRLFPQVRRL